MPNCPEHESAVRDEASSLVIPLKPASDDQATILSGIKPQASSEPDLVLSTGHRLGPYEILGAVGSGGMAAVLRAKDLELGRTVALKILPPAAAKDPDGIVRFKQEARAAAKLDHDNIARVFATGEDQGLYFIAFELVEGENLRTLIERRGVISVSDCVKIMLQVTLGLAHAAERGVVHRDIKPSNLVITPEGKAKIVDMGLARQAQTAVNGGVTQSGVTLGTFDYISPEQALDPRRADIRSDIYSLGCTIYHASTGQPPIPEGTAARKLFAHQHEPVLDPRVINPAIPDRFALILSKMMAKDPKQRYQTPTELHQDLLRFGLELQQLESQKPGASSDQGMTIQKSTSMPALAWVGAATLFIGLAFSVILSQQSPTIATPFPQISPPNLSVSSVNALSASGADSGTPPLPSVLSSQVAPQTVEELASVLKASNVAEIQLEPGKRYDLGTIANGILANDRPRLLIESAKPNSGVLPILRVGVTAPSMVRGERTRSRSLTFSQISQVTLRGINIEFFETDPLLEPGARPIGLDFQDCNQVEFYDCRIEAVEGELANSDGIGIQLINRTSNPTSLTLQNNYCGLRRGTAFALYGQIFAEATECAFPPHASCFGLSSFTGTNSERAPPGDLKLKNCSFLVDKGAVVEIEANSRWGVQAGWCLFATPPPDPNSAMMMPPTEMLERRPVVLRIFGNQTEGIRFQGRPGEKNVYYKLDPLWVANRGFTFETASLAFSNELFLDRDATEVRVPPWAEDPLSLLFSAKPWEAFRLKTTLPALRVPNSDIVLVGVRDLPRRGIKLYDPWPPPAQEKIADPRVKIIDPTTAKLNAAELPKQVYATIEAAVADARPDDILQIKANGNFPVANVILNQPRSRLTIQPYPGFKPTLTLASEASSDAALFRLQDGQISFVDLQFRLKARNTTAAASQTVVAVNGGRDCRFKDCTITLEDRIDDPCSVVTLQPKAALASNVEPKLSFEKTLIRGRGRGIVSVERSYDLDWNNSIFAVQGPLIDWTMRSANQSVSHFRFDRLSAHSGMPLFVMNGPQGLVFRPPIEVTLSRCLFATLDEAPLVQIRGTDQTDPAKLIAWSTPEDNWFHGFTEDWVLLTPRNSAIMKRYRAADWPDFMPEAIPPIVVDLTFRDSLTSRNLNLAERDSLEVLRSLPPLADNTACGAIIPR